MDDRAGSPADAQPEMILISGRKKKQKIAFGVSVPEKLREEGGFKKNEAESGREKTVQ